MKGIRQNIRALLMAFIILFASLGAYTAYTVGINGSRWFASPYNPILAARKDILKVGSILDRNYNILVQSDEQGKRVYAGGKTERLALCHVLGDPYGITATGVETFHAKYLLGFSTNIIERIYQEITSGKRVGEDVVTTIDSELSLFIYEKMQSYRGAVVLLNYKTGEILAMVSTPGFDPVNLNEQIKDISEDDSMLVNRATMGKYTPGSVFKTVTAAAVARYMPELLQQQFDCTGSISYKDGTVICPDGKAHGTQTFAEAYANSCNCVFAQLFERLGGDKLKSMAENLGFNEEFMFDDLVLYSSSYQTGERELDGAWSAIGQYKDTATPLHIAMITAAIANGGEMMEPKLIKSVISTRNFEYDKLQPEAYKKPLSKEEASILKDLMINTVKSGTGSSASLKGYIIGGKTGSAQTSEDKTVKTNAWFTGFVDSEEHPLCISIVLEQAGSGGRHAAPLAAEIFGKAIKLGY